MERSDNISHEQSEYIAFAKQTYRPTEKRDNISDTNRFVISFCLFGAGVDTALRADDIRTSSRAMIYSLFEKADDIRTPYGGDDIQGLRLD